MCGQTKQQQHFISKTEHYLKVKKPLLERQRRARINKCLESIKTLVAEIQGDTEILRMDKAVMLEALIEFMRTNRLDNADIKQHSTHNNSNFADMPPAIDGFRNGYMNAVNEISRVMATMPGMTIDIGKSVMTHLGLEFNRVLAKRSSFLKQKQQQQKQQQKQQRNIVENLNEIATVTDTNRLSPTSSGYQSDDEYQSNMSTSSRSSSSSPSTDTMPAIWRPW